MFGYVTARLGSLSKLEHERYRGCYCGLCKSLHKNWGGVGSFTLSYDITFVIMLLNSLYEPGELHSNERCLPHPIKRHSIWSSEATEYCAAMSIALAHHKLLDDIRDENSVSAKIALKALSGAYANVLLKYPDKCRLISDNLMRLTLLEQESSDDIDALINSFGDVMAVIFAWHEDEWADKLRMLGRALGGFVYVMDAYDDYADDMKKGRFNPLAKLYGEAHYKSHSVELMLTLMSECAEAFEYLPLVKDVDIMRVIIYDGVWERLDVLCKKESASSAATDKPM